MKIEKTTQSGAIVLTLEGRLDTTTAPQLQEVLIPAFDEAKEIQLDFANLAYVSSAGLRVLLMGQKTASAKSGKMTLTHVSEEIMEVFDMTGFSDLLTIK